MSETGLKKQQLRKQILAQRDEMPLKRRETLSRLIQEKLFQEEAFLKAETVFVFINFRSEPDTREIIKKAWELGKRTAVPKVEGNKMRFYRITDPGQLKPGRWGILEPDPAICQEAVPSQDDFMVLPGSVFDARCHRIGYGGGFYDRYLTEHGPVENAAIAFSFQVVQEVPAEEFDIRPDCVITETEIYRLGAQE